MRSSKYDNSGVLQITVSGQVRERKYGWQLKLAASAGVAVLSNISSKHNP